MAVIPSMRPPFSTSKSPTHFLFILITLREICYRLGVWFQQISSEDTDLYKQILSVAANIITILMTKILLNRFISPQTGAWELLNMVPYSQLSTY